MNRRLLFAAFALLAAPMSASAHGPTPTPMHGGSVQEVSEHWVELVLKSDEVTVYVREQDSKPLSTKEWSGKATVLVGGKSQVVTLTPAGENSATAKLSGPISGRVTAVLQLTIDGKPATVRFAVG